MTLINPTLPTIGDPRGSEETDVRNALVALLSEFNGNIDNSNLRTGAAISWSKMQTAAGSGLLAEAGSNADGVVRRGKSIVATEETRASTSYGLMTTPDRVQNVVLPTNGLLVVAFQALWKSSTAAEGRACLFLGANQVKFGTPNAVPQVSEAQNPNATNYVWLRCGPYGLVSDGGGASDASSVNTGMTVGTAFDRSNASLPAGGFCLVWAAAGTYDVTVQWKANAVGTVTAKERKLWVQALAF